MKKKPSFIMMIGLPGSGKSRFSQIMAKEYDAEILKLEDFRRDYKDDSRVKANKGYLYGIVTKVIKERLEAGKSVVYDATNTAYRRRVEFLRRLSKVEADKICCVVCTPYAECLETNQQLGEKAISSKIMDNAYKSFYFPYWYEGWDYIRMVNIPKAGDLNELIDQALEMKLESKYRNIPLGYHLLKVERCLTKEGAGIELISAGLLHDIGKLYTKEFKYLDGSISPYAQYYQHSFVSTYEALPYLNQILGESQKLLLEALILIQWHETPSDWRRLKNVKYRTSVRKKYQELWGPELTEKIDWLDRINRQVNRTNVDEADIEEKKKIEEDIIVEDSEETIEEVAENALMVIAKEIMDNPKLLAITQKIDHTILKPDASKADIIRLCDEAIAYQFASVCVNSMHIPLVAKQLADTPVKACAVVGFPLGAMSTEAKVYEARQAIKAGAKEIDMVIAIGALKDKDYVYVEREIKKIVKVAKASDVLVKVIIETCLLSNEQKKIATNIVLNAGADYVKTSTGFSTGGATVDDVELMKEIAKDDLKVKASGGIRTYAAFIKMIEAGAERIGTSNGIEIIIEGRQFNE